LAAYTPGFTLARKNLLKKSKREAAAVGLLQDVQGNLLVGRLAPLFQFGVRGHTKNYLGLLKAGQYLGKMFEDLTASGSWVLPPLCDTDCPKDCLVAGKEGFIGWSSARTATSLKVLQVKVSKRIHELLLCLVLLTFVPQLTNRPQYAGGLSLPRFSQCRVALFHLPKERTIELC